MGPLEEQSRQVSGLSRAVLGDEWSWKGPEDLVGVTFWPSLTHLELALSVEFCLDCCAESFCSSRACSCFCLTIDFFHSHPVLRSVYRLFSGDQTSRFWEVTGARSLPLISFWDWDFCFVQAGLKLPILQSQSPECWVKGVYHQPRSFLFSY